MAVGESASSALLPSFSAAARRSCPQYWLRKKSREKYVYSSHFPPAEVALHAVHAEGEHIDEAETFSCVSPAPERKRETEQSRLQPCRIRGTFSQAWLTLSPSRPSMEVREISARMATIDEDLGQIEKDIRQLKIEYDQYFGGGRKRPPTEIEWRIDLLIKRYNERGGELKFAQRFRFNNLAQTYAKYKDIFRKKTKQKEEGTIQRHFGAAAKEIEAIRAKEQEKEEAAAAAAGNAKAFRMICSQPEKEPDKVEKLYEAFLQAKLLAGEHTGKLSRSSFNQFVLKKTKELQTQKNCKDVEYVVETIEGQVKLKAFVKA